MKYFYSLILTLLFFSLQAQTVVDIIANSEVHTTLETAVIEAELVGELSGEGPFTVFAPTDDAFAAIDANYLNELLAEPNGDLRKILRYHIVNAEVPAAGLNDGDEAQSLLGQMLTLHTDGETIMINEAVISVTDIVGTNGIVHVIDAVLLPPANNVVDVILNSEAHEMLEIAIIEAQLNEPLSIGGPYTIFAPTDAAFETVDMDYLQELLGDPTADLRQILRYHVIEDRVKSDDLFDQQIVTSALGQALNITVDDDVIQVNNALVTVSDIETFNGVVHVIDAVILPPANRVIDVIVNSEVHGSLENAVIDADLSDQLSGEGPYTVFAPTDEAFANLDPDVLNELLSDPNGDLQRLLSYHIANTNATAITLSNGEVIRTNLGQNAVINKTEDDLLINEVLITTKDIETFNGVVHVIEEVLMPPASNVLEVIAQSDTHTVLEELVYDAMLDDDLSADGYITVFAPTDAAFDAVDETLLNALLADPMGALQEVLWYHVLDTEVLSGDLSDGQSVTTVANQDINFSIGDEVIINGNAMLTLADIQTYNGTVHVIDQVLLPQLTATQDLKEVGVNILPNPTTDYLLVELPLEMQNKEVEAQLINLSGATVQSWVINNDASRLDVSDNISGTYILLLNTPNEFARSKVIIK